MPIDDQLYGPPWTILKILQWTKDYFERNDVENPRSSAEVLLSQSLNCRRIDLYMQFDQPLHENELLRYRDLIKRRVRHEPLAYISGQKEFWSLNFIVAPAVLIPRPETELLVEKALQFLPGARQGTGIRILEPATGSGAISVSLAYERPDCLIVASDISSAAIGVASKNAEQHKVLDRISFFVGNWLDSLRPGQPQFDMLVYNPPYIRTSQIDSLQPDIRDYEPRQALDGGIDGLRALSFLIDTAHRYITSGGYMILEIGYDQGAAVEELGYRCGAYNRISLVKDYSGHNRLLCLCKK